MLISELKKTIKNYKKDELEKIIVELYKRIPKAKKEDYNIDSYIENVNNKVVKKEIDFNSLKEEIIYFLSCVDNGLYCMPNKIIPKKERSSWRFKVKRYYKELIVIPPESENGGMATFLLIELFKRLSIGSNTLLFINWETFRALGVSQYNYYDVIIKRILYNGYSKDALKKCINLLNIKKDPYGLSYDMFEVYLDNLKTTFNREDSLELINEKIIELKEEMKKEKNSTRLYSITGLLNNYVELTLDINIKLYQVEKGIDFFKKNYIEKDKEVIEYVLLSKLEENNLIKEWIKEYEKNINEIDYRDSLKNKYLEFKEN